MNPDGTGFHTCKECHKTESLWNHTTTHHKEGEHLEDWRSVGASSFNSGEGTDQRVQSLMFMMMITIIFIPLLLGTKWMFYVKNVFWCLWWCYFSHLMTKVKTHLHIQGLQFLPQFLPLCFCHVNKEPMHCCWQLIFHAGQVLSYHWSKTWRCWCYRLINGDLMMPIKISRTRYTPQILR